MTTIRRYLHLPEAQLDQSRLEAEGIRSFLKNEHAITMIPLYSVALGQVELQVADADVERAARLLEDEAPSEEVPADTPGNPSIRRWMCALLLVMVVLGTLIPAGPLGAVVALGLFAGMAVWAWRAWRVRFIRHD